MPTLRELDGARARRTAACCSAGSCSRPTARRCSSTTCASATPSARCVVPRLASDLVRAPARSRRRADRDAGRVLRRRVRRCRARRRGLSARAATARETSSPASSAPGAEGVLVFHAGTAADDRRARRDERRPGADGHRGRRRRWPRRATGPTRPPPRSRGRASTTVATSAPRHFA